MWVLAAVTWELSTPLTAGSLAGVIRVMGDGLWLLLAPFGSNVRHTHCRLICTAFIRQGCARRHTSQMGWS
jgi:hypothetical protein